MRLSLKRRLFLRVFASAKTERGSLDHGSRKCWASQNSDINGSGDSRQCSVIACQISKDAQFSSICDLILALKEGTEKLFKDFLLALRVSFED